MRKTIIFAIVLSLILMGFHLQGMSLESSEETLNAKVAKQFFLEFLNKGKINVADKIIDKDCMSYSNGVPWKLNGLAGFKKTVKENHQVHYKGWTFTIEDLLSKGNKVVVRYRFKGLHKKNAKKFAGEGIAIYKFVNGKIVENRYTWDTWTYHQQLGYTANSPQMGRSKNEKINYPLYEI